MRVVRTIARHQAVPSSARLMQASPVSAQALAPSLSATVIHGPSLWFAACGGTVIERPRGACGAALAVCPPYRMAAASGGAHSISCPAIL